MSDKLKDTVTTSAAALAVTELGLGSLVHGLKIPLGGHWLSLNQGAFLSRASWKLRSHSSAFKAPFYISQISALLKSLSPAGNKLGPMLSISMQGALFSLPVALIGPNLLGISIGMVGLSVWAFAQPFVTYYLFFGNDLWKAAGFFLDKMQGQFGAQPETVVRVLVGAVILKAFLSVGVGLTATRVSDKSWGKYQARLRGGPRDSRPVPGTELEAIGVKARVGFVLRDMLKPFFLFSTLLMAVFFYFSERSGARVVWLSLRPLAIAFLFFYFARSPWLGRLADRMRSNPRFAEFMLLFDSTLRRLSSEKISG